MLGKKMFLDCNPISQPEGTTREVWNMISTKLRLASFNEYGFEKVAVSFPVDGIIKGGIEFPDNDIIIFVKKETGNNEIGVIKSTTFEYEKIVGLPLNFDNPIKGVDTYDEAGNKIIVWTDEVTPPRILNIGELPFQVDGNNDIINILDLNNTLLFPESTSPIIEISTNVGGNLLSGAYFINAAYEDDQGTRTEFHVPYGAIYINDKDESVNFALYNGCPAGTPTTKGIKITLTNVDTRYTKLVISIISKINGQYEVKNLIDIKTSATVTVIYAGTELTETGTLEGTTTKQPNYKTVKDLGILGDRLYAANLTTEEEIDYQEFANQIVLNYAVEPSRPIEDKALMSGATTSLMYGQVYAVYIRWVLKGGKVSRYFHIPGRVALSGDKDISTLATAQNLKNPDNSDPYVFQVEDTTNKNGQVYDSDGIYTYPTDTNVSNLGYWENKFEVYPDEFQDLSGQKVRHHVMPTLRKLAEVHNYATILDLGFARNWMPVLGLRASNVKRSQYLIDNAIGFQLAIAKVDVENANVLGLDQLVFCHNVSRQGDDLVWAGCTNSYVYFRQAEESHESNGDYRDFIPRRDFIRSNVFDLMKNKPNINPTHITSILTYNKGDLNTRVQDFPNGGTLTTAGDGHGQMSAGIIDVTNPYKCDVSLSPNILKKILSNQYLPPNVIQQVGSRKYVSLGCEESLIIELNNNLGTDPLNDFLIEPYLGVYFGSPNQDTHFLFVKKDPLYAVFPAYERELSHLIAINQLKNDLFVSFYNQIITPLSKGQIVIAQGGTEGQAFSYNFTFLGDCFIGAHSYISGGPKIGDGNNILGHTGAINEGLFFIRRYPTIARNNLNMRYTDGNIIGSKYYPNIPGKDWILNPYNSGNTMLVWPPEGNVIIYNEDYSAVNDLLQSEVETPILKTRTSYRNRVIRSSKYNREGGGIVGSLRTFLDQEFYEANLNRGEINNIAIMGDVLFIHHKYGLFRTIGNEALKASATEIYLGTRDIFEVEPKEQLPAKVGYLGNQQKFGTLVFKGGYVFADASQGKVFLISNSGGIIEISNTGLRNFFLEKLKGFTGDNPFDNDGLRFAYDEENNRLLFIKASSTNWFTLSYSLDENGWLCFHTYRPRFIINTRNEIISQRDIGEIMKHNSSNRCIYYDESPEECSITMVFNQHQASVLFYNVNWLSHIINNNEILRNKTFDKIRLKTSYQDTGILTLTPYQDMYNPGNTALENAVWNFNNIQLQQLSPNDAKFVDVYIEVTLYYDNTKNLDNSQNILYLYDVSAKAILAER